MLINYVFVPKKQKLGNSCLIYFITYIQLWYAECTLHDVKVWSSKETPSVMGLVCISIITTPIILSIHAAHNSV